LLRMFEPARRFYMQVQPQLILLQKTLFNIEGLGRQLYPELDLWKTARPVLATWMRERTSPRTILKEIRTHLPDAVMALGQVPRILQTAVREAAEGTAPVIEPQGLAELRDEVRRSALRRDRLIVAAALWLSGLLWLAIATRFQWLGWLQMGAAILVMLK